ncbi:MAG TPA: hypothetical protein VFB22_02375 [Candidatus Baltobacteraceae bacterium]|nr:hypothetical protein [Candidatus Baltobacteraceae bacterium]
MPAFVRRTLAVCAALIVSCIPFAARAAAPGTVVDLPTLPQAPAMQGSYDDTWAKAAKLDLAYDFIYKRPSGEPVEVYVAQDSGAIDVAFVVTQRETLIASQQTNGSSVTSDDYVGVYLWPQGAQGFSYAFFANPHGTRYQTSSENSAYSPDWAAVGHTTRNGYVVTMRIPFSAIRSGGSTTWRAQFVRETIATGSLSVWTYSPRQQNANDPAFAGTLTHVGIASGSIRPKARAQIYALGEATTRANGGDTSRMGADLSLPITPTASFVASLHPDYSNVELDQQTIAPTAFPYQYAEVRPFFTQVGQPFNYTFSCTNCPQLLYTPAIPTFRDGYAVEGTQGPFTFSAFDAVGYGRVDQGQTVDWNVETPEKVESFNVQHIGVDTADGIHDETTSFTSGYADQTNHLFVYANGGVERGSLVTSPSQANYVQAGGGYVTSTTVVTGAFENLGSQFAPVDAYVAQNDLTGWEFYYRHALNFSPKAIFHDITWNSFVSRYRDRFGRPDQYETTGQVNFDFRNLVTFELFGNSTKVRGATSEFLPYDSEGLYLGYRTNTVTPTYAQFTEGPYYHGRLLARTYLTTLPVKRRVHLTLETDEDDYVSVGYGEPHAREWLERASLDWQISREASFDVGARRILGSQIPNSFQIPTFGYLNAGNVSLAFHVLTLRNEFYVVYGDPNSLATTPALFVKWIRYIGAPKGT